MCLEVGRSNAFEDPALSAAREVLVGPWISGRVSLPIGEQFCEQPACILCSSVPTVLPAFPKQEILSVADEEWV